MATGREGYEMTFMVEQGKGGKKDTAGGRYGYGFWLFIMERCFCGYWGLYHHYRYPSAQRLTTCTISDQRLCKIGTRHSQRLVLVWIDDG